MVVSYQSISQLAGKGCSKVCTSHLHLTKPCALLVSHKEPELVSAEPGFTVLPVSLCPCCQYSLWSKHNFTALLILLSAHIFIRSEIPGTFFFLKSFYSLDPWVMAPTTPTCQRKPFIKSRFGGQVVPQTLDWICKKDLCRHVDEGSCWQLGMAHAWYCVFFGLEWAFFIVWATPLSLCVLTGTNRDKCESQLP